VFAPSARRRVLSANNGCVSRVVMDHRFIRWRKRRRVRSLVKPHRALFVRLLVRWKNYRYRRVRHAHASCPRFLNDEPSHFSRGRSLLLPAS
jgi:hypothetical protein